MEMAFLDDAWWPTMILEIPCDGGIQMNATLKEFILDHASKKSGATTPIDKVTEVLLPERLAPKLLNGETLAINELRETLMEGIRAFVSTLGDPDAEALRVGAISCVPSILGHGESLSVHHHEPAFLTAEYIIQTGLEGPSCAATREEGYTAFYRPGFADRSMGDQSIGSLWDSDWRIARAPVAGTLTILPGYLRHEVRPHFSAVERISLIMDIYLRPSLDVAFSNTQWLLHDSPPIMARPNR